MKISFDIYCDKPASEPSYRLFVNDEIIAERDYVVPVGKQGVYVCNIDVDIDEPRVEVQSLQPEVAFSIENLEVCKS